MQLPERIISQNFSEDRTLNKHFLVKTLRGFFSEKREEDQQNLDKLNNTLQDNELRASFVQLLDTINNIQEELIEPQLKLNLLKNIAQFSANDIKLLCESFTQFNNFLKKLSENNNNNKLIAMVLLYAIQFPCEYKSLLTELQKLLNKVMIEENDNKTLLEIIRILSSFIPRSLKFIFNHSSMIKISGKSTIPLSEHIVDLAKGAEKKLSLKKLTTFFTQSIYIDLLDKNIILFQELHQITDAVIKNIDLLSAYGIEINTNLIKLFISGRTNSNFRYTQSNISEAIYQNYNFTADSCYIFLLITELYAFWRNKKNVSFALQIIKSISIDLLLIINKLTVEINYSVPEKESLLILLLRELLKLSSLTDELCLEIKKLAESFCAREITSEEFLKLVNKKIDEQPEIVAAKKKEAEQQKNSPPATASYSTLNIGNSARMVPTISTATAATIPRAPVQTGAINVPHLPHVFAKPAPLHQAAYVPADARSVNQPAREHRVEVPNKARLKNLRILFATNVDLGEITQANIPRDDLNVLLTEIYQLHCVLTEKKNKLTPAPAATQVAKPAATTTPVVTLTMPNTHSAQDASSSHYQTTISNKRTQLDVTQVEPKSAHVTPAKPSAALLAALGIHNRPSQNDVESTSAIDDEITDVENDKYLDSNKKVKR